MLFLEFSEVYSRIKYREIYLKLEDINNNYTKIKKPQNGYDNYYNELENDLSIVFLKYKSKDYSQDKLTMKKLEEQKVIYIKQIENYLKSKGMNEENIKDAQSASANIENTKDELLKLKNQIKEIRKEKNQFNTIKIDEEINNFSNKINEELKIINESFKKISTSNLGEVKIIKVEYKLNNDIFDSVFEQFMNILNENHIKISEKATFKNYLKDVNVKDVIDINNSINFISKINNRSSQTYQTLLDIFSNELYFQVYKLLILKNSKDIENNKILKVYYDLMLR